MYVEKRQLRRVYLLPLNCQSCLLREETSLHLHIIGQRGKKRDSQSLLIPIKQRNLTTFVKLCKCTRAWKGQRDEMIARQIVIQMWQLFHPEL